MIAAQKDLPVGHQIEPLSYDITPEKIATYSRFVFYGKDTRNIHTDDEVAQRAGLPRALAQGRYPVAYISERLMEFFGLGRNQGGKIDVAFVKGIFPVDKIAVKGVVTEKQPEGDKVRLQLDVWLENQDGEKVTAGTASGLVDA
jgi:acyl dehydratase